MTMIKEMSDEQLIEVWESTETSNDENIAMVRGWLMDEIEERFPEAFEAWLDSECPEDGDLRNYVFA